MLRTLSLFAIVLVAAGFTPAQARSASWLNGTWTGTGYQIDNNETWTMRLTAARGTFVIEYPSLKCSGVWKPIALGRTVATFREHITRGEDQCTNRGTVTIEKLGPRQMDFRYSNPGSREVIASAILKKLALRTIRKKARH